MARRSLERGGKVAATPAAVQERLIRIWASPQGAAKSALAGTMTDWRLGANPGTAIPEGVIKAGNTSLVFVSLQASLS